MPWDDPEKELVARPMTVVDLFDQEARAVAEGREPNMEALISALMASGRASEAASGPPRTGQTKPAGGVDDGRGRVIGSGRESILGPGGLKGYLKGS